LNRNKIVLLVFASIVAVSFSFCSSDNPTNPTEQNLKDYYPGLKGTTYKYEIEQQDSSGNIKKATRFVYYGDEIQIDTTSYREQKDSVDDGTNVLENISYFRKTETGVFYFTDTTGLLSFVPDSIRNLISLQDEMRLFLNPLSAGSFWPVYRVTINLQPGFSFKPIDINGYFVAREDITLNLETGISLVSTEKVKYDMDVMIDLNQTVQSFSAQVWFAEKIGIVKIEGSSLLINILLTGELNLGDTTANVRHNLLNYDIK
jgi:hypothetical protein